MFETGDAQEPAATGAQATGRASIDMAPLIENVHAYIEGRTAEVTAWQTECPSPEAFSRRTGFAPRRRGKPEIVLGPDVALELGHPSTASLPILLTTVRQDLVRHGTVSLLGPDLDRMIIGEKRPFAQVVMLALQPDSTPDPFDLDSVQFLINRLPGYMVRAIPGRLWVRVSKNALAGGLTLRTVAEALTLAFRRDLEGVNGIEIFFVTASAPDVESLRPVALEASVISGRHKKLALSPEGDLECSELSCETCDEKPVCDDLREIIRKRRRET